MLRKKNHEEDKLYFFELRVTFLHEDMQNLNETKLT